MKRNPRILAPKLGTPYQKMRFHIVRLNNSGRLPLDQVAQLFQHSRIKSKSLTDEFEPDLSGFSSFHKFCMAVREIMVIASKSRERTVDSETRRIIHHLARAYAELQKVLHRSSKPVGLQQSQYCQGGLHGWDLSRTSNLISVLARTSLIRL